VSNVPDRIELIVFECSSCGKSSRGAVRDNKMKCEHCGSEYERRDGEWMPTVYWKVKDKQ